MRVALIPTGKLELLGLKPALDRAFPGHDFHCVPFAGNDPFRSFTSATLPLATLHEKDSSLSELIGAIVDQLYPEPKSDIVFALDDLELRNRGNETIVVDEFRLGVARHIERVKLSNPTDALSIQQLLRSSASFHLSAPMIESWLFADPDGPANAHAPAAHLPPRLVQGKDPEEFETDDREYSADTGKCCTKTPPKALPPNRRTDKTPEWLKTDSPQEKVKIRREIHPKRYMAWLCRSGQEKNCSTYSDRAGAVSLQQLAWGRVLETPTHMCFLRALLFDLADALGSPPAGFSLAGHQNALTSLKPRLSPRVLRNL